ncbi:MAG: hypothetical protein WBZ19_07710 [Chthoniobacterales bacterium]
MIRARPRSNNSQDREPQQIATVAALGVTQIFASGPLILSLDLPIIALALVFHGAGMGVMSIARGTVPLALLGADGYAVLMGRLAAPSLLAQAISPIAAAVVLETRGPTEVLFALLAIALLNVLLVAILVSYRTRWQNSPIRDTMFSASSNQ